MDKITLPKSASCIKLEGHSRAASATMIFCPELNIYLDCGLPADVSKKGSVFFITHCHLDHFGGLHKVLIQAEISQPIIITHGAIIKQLQQFVMSSMSLTKSTINPKIMSHITINGTNYYDKIPMVLNKKKCVVEIIECFHSAPCNGYGFSEYRTRLRKDIAERKLTQEEIGKLVASGENVNEEVLIPLFCFLGDTDHRVFEDAKDINKRTLKHHKKGMPEPRMRPEISNPVFTYPVIIVECTYIDPDHEREAKDDKHMHWKNLKPIVLAHPEIHFILIHFSARYRSDYIDDFFRKQKISNVQPAFHRIGSSGSGSSSPKKLIDSKNEIMILPHTMKVHITELNELITSFGIFPFDVRFYMKSVDSTDKVSLPITAKIIDEHIVKFFSDRGIYVIIEYLIGDDELIDESGSCGCGTSDDELIDESGSCGCGTGDSDHHVDDE